MKLCELLHESTDSCPTCGGKVNAQGSAISSTPTEIVFPNKEGMWLDPKTKEVLHDPTNMRSKETEVLPAVPQSAKKQPYQGQLRDVLRMRKDEVDERRGSGEVAAVDRSDRAAK